MNQTQLKREDFGFEANSRGYMLKYKGQNIGGAGILKSAKGPTGRQASNQVKDYIQLAEIDINRILLVDPGRFKEAIDQVNKSKGV